MFRWPNLKGSVVQSLFCGIMIFGIFISLVLLWSSSAYAESVVLDLSPRASQGILGHKIYYGTSSANFTYCIDIGSSTSCEISGLEEGSTYYFAATSYDASGFESGFSNRVSTHISIQSGSDSNDNTSIGTTGEESVVDNDSGGFSTGRTNWARSSFISGAHGGDYLYAPPGDGSNWAKWEFYLSTSGDVEVFASWTAFSNRSDVAPFEIINNGNRISVFVDQTTNGGRLVSLGTYWLEAGKVEVVLRDTPTGYVVADAVKIVSQ